MDAGSAQTALVRPRIPLPHHVEDPAELVAVLRTWPAANQIHWMRSLGASQLKRLWNLSLQSDAILPVEAFATDAVTICPGKNHLPVFCWFEKRFAKVGDQVVGYNETGWEKLFVGAGHFTVHPVEGQPAEVLIDYGRPPERTHPDFPPLSDNQRLGGWPAPLERIVYGGGMRDRLRRVGGSLLIGTSVVDGFSLQKGAFFALHLPEENLGGQ